jgi:hypothetical protein
MEQRMLAQWLDAAGVLWCHPPNEGAHKAAYYAKRARLGVKAGVPDVLIFSPPPERMTARGVAIELKSQSPTTRLTDTQRDWLESLRQCGWLARVCHGADSAIDWLQQLGFGAVVH